jgi:hypothetical protein
MLNVIGLELRDDVRLVKKYAYFCLSKFVPNAVLNKAQINIKFIHHTDLADKAEQKELRECGAWLVYDGIVNDRKKFSVTIDTALIKEDAKKQITRYKTILKDLGHEMIHVKQYLLNEMFDYSDGRTVRFMGGIHTFDDAKLDWSYWDSPWEVEAYGRMEGLYHMFLKKMKEDKKA